MEDHEENEGLGIIAELEKRPCDRENCEVRLIAAKLQEEIAERRRIEACLADAQRVAHLGHWDWNILTSELSWSDETYRIFDVDPHEFEATYAAFLQLVHPADRDLVVQAVRQSVAGHSGYSMDHRIIRPNGEVRIVHEQAEVTFDDRGNACRMLGIVQDVTESRLVSLELERKEAMLRRVLEALPVGVWIADETGRITTTNQAAVEIWGAAPHLALSEYGAYTGWDLKSGQRLESGDWAMARALLTGKPYGGQEARIETFDGRTRVIRTWGAPVFDATGKLTGAIAVAEDITSQFAAKQSLSRVGEELRKLTQYQIGIREREKAAIARELHEGIGQMLSGALMQAGSVKRDETLSPSLAAKCIAIEGLLKEAIEAVRRLACGLRPPLLDHFGLEQALDWLVNETRETAGIACSLSVSGQSPDADDVRSLELFRICQEAISSGVASKASEISIWVGTQDSGIRLEVRANGAPVADSEAGMSPAIIGMRERAAEMRGTFERKVDPGGGTVLSVWIPNCAAEGTQSDQIPFLGMENPAGA